MYKIASILILSQLICTHSRNLPEFHTNNNNNNSEELSNIVEETQHALCRISTQDFEATANATITRQLTGVCTTTQLDSRLSTLEKNLIREINKLKTHIHQPPTINQQNSYQSNTSQKIDKLLMKNRLITIDKLNMTIQKDNTSIKFYYFWQIENIIDLLSIQTDRFLQSGDFNFAGNHLYIKLHYEKNQIFLQLSTSEPIQLVHQFTLIRLNNENLASDIISPLLYCDVHSNCDTFPIAFNAFVPHNYNYYIQLIIYLQYL